MITISNEIDAVTFTESQKDSDLGTIEPRISRTATLDGGSVFTFGGCTHADRTINIVAYGVGTNIENRLRAIVMQAMLIQMCNMEGVFLGSINSFSSNYGDIRLSFLVKEKLTAD